jgi:hypothetical protein
LIEAVTEEHTMSASDQGQELLIHLETALHRLVESFWDEPYRFFTEADAVAALESWVAKRPELAQIQHTVDGFETSLLHREYPTFFRFDKDNPTQREGPPAKRGHYDLVLLDPAYVQGHKAETVINRDIGDRGDLSSPPLLAAVEFKLLARGWSPGQVRGLEQDLGKLKLALESPADVGAAYLCILQRDVSGIPRRWERHWSTVEKMLAKSPNIRTVSAVCWPNVREPFVHYSGLWITAPAE